MLKDKQRAQTDCANLLFKWPFSLFFVLLALPLMGLSFWGWLFGNSAQRQCSALEPRKLNEKVVNHIGAIADLLVKRIGSGEINAVFEEYQQKYHNPDQIHEFDY